MRRRKLVGALVLVLVLLIAAAVFARKPRPDRVTRENLDRIETGMSRAEVEAILGAPGDYRTQPTEYVDLGGSIMHPRFGPDGQPIDNSIWYWRGNDLDICLFADESGKVMLRGRYPTQRLTDSILWRAKRLWQEWFP
jgi:hypothetical protein